MYFPQGAAYQACFNRQAYATLPCFKSNINYIFFAPLRSQYGHVKSRAIYFTYEFNKNTGLKSILKLECKWIYNQLNKSALTYE